MNRLGLSAFVAFVVASAALLFSQQSALAQFTQQGPKLVGTGSVGSAVVQGCSVALSADGNTAIVGGFGDNNGDTGAAWVFIRSGGVWTQQGAKLVGTGSVGTQVFQGSSVALSADGNTAIVGGNGDNGGVGAVWVFTRSNGVWTQQGSKLVGTGYIINTGTMFVGQGSSVALSGDGNTAIVGGWGDNAGVGAAWVYTRSGGVWTQQGNKLVGTGAVGQAGQGAVALSADGNTAMVGGGDDNGGVGAAWVFTQSNGIWTQQGSKLVGTGAVGQAGQGSVALSADGNTAIVGGYGDNSGPIGSTGAAWVYTRNGDVWTQQGSKLVGTDAVGNADQGISVSLSSDGNTAIVGGEGDNTNIGAAWVFVPSLQVTPATNIAAAGNPGGPFAPSSFQYQLSASVGSINYSISGVPNWLTASATSGTASSGTTVTFTVNANANSLAVGTYGPTNITFTNADTGQGTQTLTATLTVNPPALQVAPTTNIAASGTQGGPFSPSTFSYTLSAAYGSVNYSISGVPNWLTPSSTSGTASSGTTVTFTVNANATGLTPNTYVNSINFNNTTNGQGNTARVATLIVNPPPLLQVTPTTNMVASGTQSGPFSPSSFSYQLSASTGSIDYSISGVPNWLTASATSGTASSGTRVTFTVNANANTLAVGTYSATVTFTNSDTSQGSQIRTATLNVIPPAGAIFTEFSIPTANSVPLAITAGPDGALWFVEQSGGNIGRITTAGVVTEFAIPTVNSRPWGITVGPDGALWFTESGGGNIGRITTAGVITEYNVPSGGSGRSPTYITTGPDGALWFTEQDYDKIGRITTAGVVTEFVLPSAPSTDPIGITAGPDGALWFAHANSDPTKLPRSVWISPRTCFRSTASTRARRWL
jgi:streptogramin lyase